MRIIKRTDIKKTIIRALIKANIVLRIDVLSSLKSALRKERNKRADYILKSIIENARIAKKGNLPICQDTGMPVVFLEVGQNVKIVGGNLEDIINEAIAEGTKKGFLRKSIVEPLFNRRYVKTKLCIIHTRIVKGSRLKITVLPKGFGCENKTTLKMFKPTADLSKIEDF
ncbi:MAG: fumarate hydratase, partial [Candidatus Omnitrophica bacterium]|nr:fumarate hydratase [Candidatus Omnitrophota bacterium]